MVLGETLIKFTLSCTIFGIDDSGTLGSLTQKSFSTSSQKIIKSRKNRFKGSLALVFNG